MSNQVDNRTVQMQFDNKQFEANAKNSMSTLDKLKNALHLPGASKGLDEVKTKFSALEVMGVTALANITNSAVEAGKRIVSALTIDPVKQGFSEYELKMDSIKTIRASTGKDLKEITKYLDELNTYSDQTIYSFSDMTQNIGKFTNAGVELEDAVMAIKGISNEAAVSGANANEASRAMYNFAQALSAGYVKLIDWKSIENANMATVEFKQQLIDAAVAADQLKKLDDGMYMTRSGNTLTATQNFNDTLQDQWMTSEVLISTLKDYADETTEIGKKAKAAAQDVTKFSQIFDILKETAQSGWAKTWEIIFGDLDKAKALFTPISNFLNGIIDKMSDWRNNILEGAFTKNFRHLKDILDGVIGPIKDMGDLFGDSVNKVKGLVKTAADYEKVVDEIIAGKWKNAPTRWQDLEAAGYDWAHAQNLVNERLGCSVRHATNYKEAQDDQVKNSEKLGKLDAKRIEDLLKLSDAELLAMGYTKEQIAALRELQKIADKLGLSVSFLIENIDEIDGRWLFINTFKNAWEALAKVFKTVKEAWQDIFPPKTAEQRANSLFNIIAAMHKFSTKLKMSDETAEKFRRTMRGIFALLDVIVTVIAGPIKIAFKFLVQLLGALDIDILSLTASLGDALVKFRNWVKAGLDFSGVISKIVPYIKKAIAAFKEWAASLKESDNIPRDIIAGLVKGLWGGFKLVGNVLYELGKFIIDKICSVLGIHSPSREFMEIGKNIILGLVKGIADFGSLAWKAIKNVVTQCLQALATMDFSSILASVLGIGAITATNNVAKAIQAIATPLAGLADMFEDMGDMFEGIGKNMKAKALERKSRALLNMAIAIGVLAVAVALLTKLDTGKMWGAVGAIGALAAIMLVLTIAVDKMTKSMNPTSTAKQAGAILALAGSLLIIAIALKKISTIDGGDLAKAVTGLLGAVIGMMLVMKTYGKSVKASHSANMDKAGAMLIKMSIAILIMVTVIKAINKLDAGEIAKGIGVISLFALLFAGIILVSKTSGKHASKAGTMLLKMSVAILLMVGVIKTISGLNDSEVNRGLKVITRIELLFAAIIATSFLAGKNASKAGGMLLMTAIAISIMVNVIKQVAKLDDTAVDRGLRVITRLELLFAMLIVATRFGGNQMMQAGVMLLAVSGALLVLTGVLFILSKMDAGGTFRALAIVTVLELLFMGLLKASGKATKSTGAIIAMTAAIALLAGAVVGLSFLDPKRLLTATAAISILMGMFAVLMTASKFAGQAKSLLKTSAVLTGVIVVLGGVLVALCALNPKNAIQSALALSILLMTMSMAMTQLSTIITISKGTLRAMGCMAFVVAELAVILGIMSYLDVGASINTAVALSILLAAMSGALMILSKIRSVSMVAIGAIAVLGLVIGELGIILGLLTYFNVNPSIEMASALSLLLVSMSGALVLLGVVGLMGPAAFIGIAALAVLIVGLGAVLVAIGALCKYVPKVEEFLDKGIVILGKIGYAIGSFVGNIIAGLAASVSDALPAIGENLSKFMKAVAIDQATLEGVGRFSLALLALTATELINAVASWVPGEGLPGMAKDLSLFMDNAKGFFDGLKTIKPETMTAAKLLGETLLSLSASELLDGIASWFTGDSSMADWGTQLSGLGEGLKAFEESTKGVNPENVKAAADAAKAVAEMTDTIPNEGGVAGFFAGENSISKFGSELWALGHGLKDFATETAGLKPEDIKAAASAATAVAKMTHEIPNEGGVAGWFAGENSISKFGSELWALGHGLKDFATETAGLKPEDIKAAASAATSIAKMTHEIPNEGGVAGWFAGENSISKFGSELWALGHGLKAFATETAGLKPEDIKAAASAAEAIAKMTNKIPNSDGVASWFAGDNSISKFGGELWHLGHGLKSFATETSDIDATKMSAVVGVAGSLVDMINKVPNSGGMAAWFSGDKSISKYSGELKKLGQGLYGFAYEVAGIGTPNLIAAKDLGQFIVDLTNMKPSSFDGLGEWGTNIKWFGTNVKAFYSKVSEISEGAITTAKNAADTLKEYTVADFSKLPAAASSISSLADSLKKMSGVNADSISGAGNALNGLAGIDVGSIATSFGNAAPKFKEAGASAVTAFVEGINGQKNAIEGAGKGVTSSLASGITSDTSPISKACKSLLTTCTTALSSVFSTFMALGTSAVSGFAAGISMNTFLATAKAKAMAQAALEAARKELDVNSPSKVFRALGMSVPEGFAQGIDKLGGAVIDSSTAMADTAINGVGNAIAKIASIISTDIDAQPTIRPVVDLTDVQSGAAAINGMLYNQGTMAVKANGLGTISASMAQYQNGREYNELISNIKALRKDFADMPRESITINGITYDDGSNINEAVQTLVRAARIERRV